MANKHSNKTKHKKEKHKKHKKHKKERKHRRDSPESEEKKVEPLKREEWNFFDAILSDSNVTVKNRNDKGTKRPTPEKMGQNVRELNPYWKDGGCGLPPNSASTSKLNFLKPGDNSSIQVKGNLHQRNWRKKDAAEQQHRPESNYEKPDVASTSGKVLANEDLNKLAAKLMKAEIMGDTNLANKLKAELEAAKKMKEACNEQTKVVLVEKSLKKTYDGKQNYGGFKRRKVDTHDSQGRICYFPDDDKYWLQKLFEREKAGLDDDEISVPVSRLAGKTADEFDDAYLEAAASTKLQKKMEEKQYRRTIKEATIKHKALEGCKFCIDNKKKHLIMSTGKSCYLCLPEEESLVPSHCLIVPLQHEVSALHLDEDVWSEIKTYQRVLVKMFLEQEQDVVFFENARAFKHHPHCVIHCVPMDKEIGELAPIYFQKAINESESEWATNKKVVDFRNKDLRRSIPKGLPYFAVSFGTEGGFAHVIEDEYLFRKNFAEEVIGGMLDLDHNKWRKPHQEDFKYQRQKALDFLKIWKKHEFNETVSDSDSSSE